MSLSQHNVRVFFWATLFGSINLLTPVLTLFYLNRGLTEQQIFFALTAFSLAVLLAEVPTGAFADRYGPKVSFLTGCAVEIAAILLMIFAHTYWLVWLSRALSGVAATFFSGADEALLYESLKEDGQEERMGAVLGKISSATFTAGILAQVVGAFIARDLTEPQFVLLLSLGGLFVLVQFLLLSRIRNPRAFERFREETLSHVKTGMTTIRRTPNLIWLFVNFTMVFIPTYVFTTFDQPYLTENGLPPSLLGLLYGGVALLQFGLSRSVGWLTGRVSPVPLMHLTGIAILLTLAGAALVQQSLPVAMAAFFLVRLPRTVRWPVYSQLQNEYIPSGSRATTLSLLSVLDSVFDLLIVVPLAAAVAPFGRGVIFAGCATVVLLGLLFPVRRAKAVPAQPEAAVTP